MDRSTGKDAGSCLARHHAFTVRSLAQVCTYYRNHRLVVFLRGKGTNFSFVVSRSCSPIAITWAKATSHSTKTLYFRKRYLTHLMKWVRKKRQGFKRFRVDESNTHGNEELIEELSRGLVDAVGESCYNECRGICNREIRFSRST
ncbi:uncharacterized protein LOC105735116 isoform X1 [Apis florea]|uniref:uncharacterized protein LOC105735116 isoform X1 n=1 Tax=Apis florea TaxID=7463 RepID=UPI0012FF1FDC|nr:uncharacterized protein LOC105735116 isoform X1 [Apis florea]